MRCLSCRYELKHLTEHRCPECGRAFDPGDADTFEHETTRRTAGSGRDVALCLSGIFFPGVAFFVLIERVSYRNSRELLVASLVMTVMASVLFACAYLIYMAVSSIVGLIWPSGPRVPPPVETGLRKALWVFLAIGFLALAAMVVEGLSRIP